MIKKILSPNRIRRIEGSFGFIEHRFLRQGFFSSLNHHELLLYFFLIIVSDDRGMSFYSDEKICSVLNLCFDELESAKFGLIKKDLIAFDKPHIQLLSLPLKPLKSYPSAPLPSSSPSLSAHTQGTQSIRRIIQTLEEDHG